MTPIHLEMPHGPDEFNHLVLDFTGTLALDGALIPGVAERLRALSGHLTVTVLTADTFGTAREELSELPVEVRLVRNGQEKAQLVSAMRKDGVVAVGNGRNDAPMMSVAGLSIAVLGPEGAAATLMSSADVVTRNILDALDLLSHPLRLKATLRD
ncbi:MAG: HAD hydrolase family protein [Longimicrobiales bacterium]